MTNDPWAAAAMPQGNPAVAPTSPAPHAESASGFAGAYAEPEDEASGLFSGNGVQALLALFNKGHEPGTTFTGKIIAPTKAVQATSYPRAQGEPRLPQYWVTDSAGKRAPGTDAIDPRTGNPNDKVMNTVVELQTDQRVTAAQLAAIGIIRPDDFEDDGKRVWTVSGSKKIPAGHVKGQPVASSMRAMLDAIEAAIASGISISSDKAMKGLTLTVQRVQRVQPGVSTSPWKWIAKLEK